VRWVPALAAATLLSCGKSKNDGAASPTEGGQPGSQGGSANEPQAGTSGTNEDVLGDLLPIALRLDCSRAADPPSSIYVKIEMPLLRAPTLVARIDGNVCADADVAQNADAPALALRCPPRQVQQFDAYPANCTFHDIIVTLCAPGYAEQTARLQDLTSCPQGDRARPSCQSLAARDFAGYEYEPIVYALEPAPSRGGGCPSFGSQPPNTLDAQDLYLCPCSQ
jgi:hypothetical protein